MKRRSRKTKYFLNYTIMPEIQEKTNGRLLSLDFYRGLTMFLLIAEFTHLFTFFVLPQFEGTFIHAIGSQLHHVRWEGLHFWDLIQPFFMFIVGVAMPLSFSKRMARGDSYKDLRLHACLLYTSPSPRDGLLSRMPSSA